jgi:spherulation-specific family 4 protein
VRHATGQQRGIVIAAGAAGAILLAVLPLGRGSERKPSCRGALVPAYVSPQTIHALVRGPASPRLIVVNPANGPGQAASTAYGRAVRAAQDAGTHVLGYVPTTWGRRAAATVAADIRDYRSWYGVDGIFLDEAAAGAAQLPHYEALSRDVRAAGMSIVALNPGAVPAPGYFDIADVVVTYEGPYADYARALDRMPAWLRDEPPDRVAHLVYGATRDQAREIVTNPARAGYVYATSGTLPDPWQSLPPYMNDEEAIAACS